MIRPSPITLREARAYVAREHRHHRAPQGGIFAIAAVEAVEVGVTGISGGGRQAAEQIVGVVIVGRPVGRLNQDGYTAEVTRLATDGTRNACSMLYRAAWRASSAMGYRRLITYTLPEEGGASLRGAGFKLIGEAGGGSWSRASRPRVDMHPTQGKLRWEVSS